MKFRKHVHMLPFAAVAVCLAIGYATAQPPGVPNPYAIASPTGAEQINVENTGPGIATVSIAQLRDSSGYTILTGATAPTTGTTFQAPNNKGVIYANPAGTLAAWTVTTPTTPYDGERLQIFSSQTLTSFTLSAATGQTVNASPTTLAANGNVEFIYQASTQTWFRIQ